MSKNDGIIFTFLVLLMNVLQCLKRPILASIVAFVAMTILLKMQVHALSRNLEMRRDSYFISMHGVL